MVNLSRGRPLRTLLTLLVMSFVLVAATTVAAQSATDESVVKAFTEKIRGKAAILVGDLPDGRKLGFVVFRDDGSATGVVRETEIDYVVSSVMNEFRMIFGARANPARTREFAGKRYDVWEFHPGAGASQVDMTDMLWSLSRRDDVMARTFWAELNKLAARIDRVEERVDNHEGRIAALEGKTPLPPLRSATPAASPAAPAPAPAGPSSVTITTPLKSGKDGKGRVAIGGKVTDRTVTSIELYEGTTLVGKTGVVSGVWGFKPKLVSGTHTLQAVGLDASKTKVADATTTFTLEVTP